MGLQCLPAFALCVACDFVVQLELHVMCNQATFKLQQIEASINLKVCILSCKDVAVSMVS